MRYLRLLGLLLLLLVSTMVCFAWLCIGFLLKKMGFAFGQKWIDAAYETWVMSHHYGLSHQAPIETDKDLASICQKDRSTIVIANHQSWADILVIQGLLARHCPHLTFVMKSSLKWIPIFGWVCVMLNYPLLNRQRKAAKRDRDTLRQAFDRLQDHPSTVVIFVEGTRWHANKVRPPYQHVLRPKSAGLSLALQSFAKRQPLILDLTIRYPTRAPTLWQWMLGQFSCIHVSVDTPMPPTQEEMSDRKALQTWLDAQWRSKDQFLTI